MCLFSSGLIEAAKKEDANDLIKCGDRYGPQCGPGRGKAFTFKEYGWNER